MAAAGLARLIEGRFAGAPARAPWRWRDTPLPLAAALYVGATVLLDAAVDRAAAERLGLLHAPRRPADAPCTRHDLRGGRLASAHARAVGSPGRRGRRRQPARVRLRHRPGERPRDALLDARLPGVAHLDDARQPDLRGLVPRAGAAPHGRRAAVVVDPARRARPRRPPRPLRDRGPRAGGDARPHRQPRALARDRGGGRSGEHCCSRPCRGAAAWRGRRWPSGSRGSRSWRSSTCRADRSSACGATPVLGRLAHLFGGRDQANAGDRARVLVWQGALRLTHLPAPIVVPGRGPDGAASLRPVVGFGAETMQDVFGAVYDPAFEQAERRNPDISAEGVSIFSTAHPRPLAQRDARQPGDRRRAGARRVPGAHGGRAGDRPGRARPARRRPLPPAPRGALRGRRRPRDHGRAARVLVGVRRRRPPPGARGRAGPRSCSGVPCAAPRERRHRATPRARRDHRGSRSATSSRSSSVPRS